MNRFEKSLDRIKRTMFPQDCWTDADLEHYKTIVDALEIAAAMEKVKAGAKPYC